MRSFSSSANLYERLQSEEWDLPHHGNYCQWLKHCISCLSILPLERVISSTFVTWLTSIWQMFQEY
jgi:hypothetical protein